MLKVKGLVKDYTLDSGTTVRALNNVSFDVKDGEIVGITGSSGSGKSTLLRVIRGVEPFSGGEIELDGVVLTPSPSNEDIKKIRKLTAIHLQRNFGLWTGPAIENIIRKLYSHIVGHEALPEPDSPYYDEIREESMEYLKVVGLDHKAMHFSGVLSGGEKQRLLIARQLAAKPKLMLLDEPATMTDPATKQEVLDTLKRVNEEYNIKMLVVSHLPEIHDYLADRLIWLEGGEIRGEGEPGKVLRKFMEGIKPPVPLQPLEKPETVIKVVDISKRYWLFRQGEVLDIEEMNVEFHKGEITALIGPSGAGKTTLLHAMDGLVFPDEGEILFKLNGDWIDMTTYTPRRMELRRRMSIMYQEFALSPHSTIQAQIAYRMGVKGQNVVEEARKRAAKLGIPDEILDEIYRLTDQPEDVAKEELAKMGFTPRILQELFPSYPLTEVLKFAEPVFEAVKLPLSTLSKRPYQLSGGENVRAALALALTTNPEYLLLDEPFGDLDPLTLREVANAIKNVNKTFNTTIIFVSHHMDFVKEVAHRAIVIDNGKITMEGDPNKVCDEYVKQTKAAYLKHSLKDYLPETN